MKKLLVATTVLSLCALTLRATQAVAAEKTKGSINFITDTNGGVIVKPDPKPDPKDPQPEIEIPEDGGHTGEQGELMFTFIPNFNFEEKVLTGAEITSFAKPIKYTEKGTSASGYIPPFVQVNDGRGTGGDFSVALSASKFKRDGKDEYLNEAYIELMGQTLANNVFTNSVDGILEGVDGFNSDGVKIPETGKGTIVILKTATDQTADGSKSSNVFESGYLPGTVLQEDSQLSGVKFTKPLGQTPKKDGYTSELTWTLSNVK